MAAMVCRITNVLDDCLPMSASVWRQDSTIWERFADFGCEKSEGQPRRAGTMMCDKQWTFLIWGQQIDVVCDGFCRSMGFQVEFPTEVIVPGKRL